MKGRIVILGGGESGVGAAILAQKQGFDVFLSDAGKIAPKHQQTLNQYGVLWEEGSHTEDMILNASEVIKSPGIPDKVALVQKILSAGIPVISEIEFAFRYTQAKMICITGSNGKTTTTLLVYHILKNAGINVGLAGNVGDSLAKKVALFNHDWYVVELSSFQLDNMYQFKADIAILTNITPDHLDRYDYKMEKYVDSKFRIIQNQTPEDAFIYCLDDEQTREALSRFEIKAIQYPFSIQSKVEQGAYLENNKLIINIKDPITMSIQDLALQGKHNVYNSMAAGIAAKLVEIRKENIRESLSDFKNIEHRLEHVAKVNGIEFINDSKATNVNSTWYALESFEEPLIWIAGGVDKGNDYEMLKDAVKGKVKALICLGKNNEKLVEAFKGLIPVVEEASSAQEAVLKSYRLGKKGDIVLLSPACASFDLFENYEDRGQQFKNAVRSL
jgi:UDP-N-acetylmuramoylalanine--D-glutamate ligase